MCRRRPADTRIGWYRGSNSYAPSHLHGFGTSFAGSGGFYVRRGAARGSRRVPRCPPAACSCIFLKPCQGRRILRADTKLNKIRVLCLFAGGRSHRRGGFFVRWGRRAPPVPAAAGVNLLRFPRPRRGRGTGGGRGEGCGRKRRGKKGQAADRPGAEQARAPTRRRRGRRSTAPEERPKGRRGGNGGPRPPCGRRPDRGAAGAAATAQERPASGPAGGAGRRQRTPANGGGCPCAPPCSPRRRPPEGASTGQAGHGAGARAEGAAARRARSCGPPTPRCKKRHPQGTPSGEKGERPGYQSPDALPGDQRVNPLQGYRTTAAALLSSPRRGRAPFT